MREFHYAIPADLILVVANSVELHVRAAILADTSSYFKPMIDSSSTFSESESIQAHRGAGLPGLPRLQLPHDDEDGMRLVCDALHGQRDYSLYRFDLAKVMAFATTADKCLVTGNEKVKYAARLALDAMAASSNTCLPNIFLPAAYWFNDAERFSRYTDHISKFSQSSDSYQNVAQSDPLYGLQGEIGH